MNLKPGRELDALVAEKVMGFQSFLQEPGRFVPEGTIILLGGDRSYWHPRSPWMKTWSGYFELPHYSTDIASAWEVLTCGKWTWTLEEMSDDGGVSCYLENEDNGIHCRTLGENAPHAICLAALKAMDRAKES